MYQAARCVAKGKNVTTDSNTQKKKQCYLEKYKILYIGVFNQWVYDGEIWFLGREELRLRIFIFFGG